MHKNKPQRFHSPIFRSPQPSPASYYYPSYIPPIAYVPTVTYIPTVAFIPVPLIPTVVPSQPVENHPEHKLSLEKLISMVQKKMPAETLAWEILPTEGKKTLIKQVEGNNIYEVNLCTDYHNNKYIQLKDIATNESYRLYFDKTNPQGKIKPVELLTHSGSSLKLSLNSKTDLIITLSRLPNIKDAKLLSTQYCHQVRGLIEARLEKIYYVLALRANSEPKDTQDRTTPAHTRFEQ